ncbi:MULTISPECIES: isoaspartyl peptidase/L-asparaginase family protein [unclassified Leeuwenhoekiella]|uniref:isoaspartyl peptidase/L-asparaginase family protein n=1 Tax=unclassified Leeuwenhoekiella TaxID=2615029 RepID=UPI000C496C19|nr:MULTISPECIES: N(4)-(beta-N-acetylglucosaminyl)-L-asparaginase [unclassified Leeuwenhoekiella]MAW96338.1 glycosylasparaginase [Leeuwenhoekiella sp.]MBA81225.1 glycosylasparaginase [Leeuwenhoekiella sp.]|tara:strand:- start:3973 stop:4983 length:1011 start_codon:yes stop_codon:yes gene_type:complete
MKRRNFLTSSALNTLALGFGLSGFAKTSPDTNTKSRMNSKYAAAPSKGPVAICTWEFTQANATAGKLLDQGYSALDAVIQGVAVEEENIKNTTVGKGGSPDREGNVTLDACVMDHTGNCGAVMCVEDITNVAALARKVMEDTPHVILAGDGAKEYALSSGFKAEDLLTEASEKAWKEWLKESKYQPIINIENHDTIGMLALDTDGNISGACTTSGLAYKMKGRVGDSPIIGSGLFVDNAVGGAVATGMGEEVIKTVGSFLIVELMRNGMSPQEACEEAVRRIVTTNPNHVNFQVAYIAINKKGETGCYCIHPGFKMMKYAERANNPIVAGSYLQKN